MRKAILGAGVFVLSVSVFGQAVPEVKSFEVASIRLHTDPPGSGAQVANDSRLEARATLLSALLAACLQPEVLSSCWAALDH